MVEETLRQVAVTYAQEKRGVTFGAASWLLLLVMARNTARSHLHITCFTHHPRVRNICIQWEHMRAYVSVFKGVFLCVTVSHRDNMV